MKHEPVCVWNVSAELGEGPLWLADEQVLWFVDIRQNQLHRFDPGTLGHTSIPTGENPSFIVRDADKHFIVGLRAGLHHFDPETRAFALLHEVEPDHPGNRLNDGAVDRKGRLWFGSMDNSETAATGSLYRLDADGPVAVDRGYFVTNGPAFSPDGKVLYHTDSAKRTIYAFDMAEDSTLSNKRVFVTIEDGAGYPDGPVVDSEGCLWTGLYAGWAARRYTPRGELLATVSFPCANVTKLAFGGPDLRTAYATTAWKGLDARAREAQPLAGALFSFETDVPGLP